MEHRWNKFPRPQKNTRGLGFNRDGFCLFKNGGRALVSVGAAAPTDFWNGVFAPTLFFQKLNIFVNQTYKRIQKSEICTHRS